MCQVLYWNILYPYMSNIYIDILREIVNDTNIWVPRMLRARAPRKFTICENRKFDLVFGLIWIFSLQIYFLFLFMELLSHQEKTLAFYTSRLGRGLKFAADFSETGTGKSLPAMELARLFLEFRWPDGGKMIIPRPIFYITLAGLKGQVQNELAKLKVSSTIISGTAKERQAAYARCIDQPLVVILNYEQVLRDANHLQSLNPMMVIVDECTRLANQSNKTRKLLMRILPKDCFRIGLTGTPVSNNPVDLWGIMDFLSPGLMGNYYSFVQKFCVKPKGQNFIVGYRNLDEVKKHVEPHYIRHTRDQVLDLKGITSRIVTFKLDKSEREFYDKLRDGYIREIKEQLKVKKPWNLEQLMLRVAKLLEVCDDVSLVSSDFDGAEGNSSKMGCLIDLIKTFPEDDHIVIFSRFSRMTKILGRVLGAPVIDGDVSQEDRSKILESFQAGNERVLVFSNAGAFGLNVQRANIVIHYDQPQSVAQAVQRTARAYRYLQTKPVLEYFLIADDTYESRVQKKLTNKLLLASELISDNPIVSSSSELLELI